MKECVEISSEFRSLLKKMPELLEKLLAMEPIDKKNFPTKCIKKGVYLFTDPDNDEHLYVGRSDNIRRRWGLQSNSGSRHNQASFALRMAREDAGISTDYQFGTKKQLEKCEDFRRAFEHAKEQVQKMKFRYVEEGDSNTQCLLEFYAAITLKTPYNEFHNH